MSSILTNSSAIVALQTLKSINSNLSKTQNEISTGKSINSAKDNAALWSIAKTMEGDKDSSLTIQKNLNVAGQTVASALTGANKILDQLKKMHDLATSAGSSEMTFDTIQNQITELSNGITANIASTQSNGVNLLSTNGINGGDTYSVVSSLDRAGTTVTASSITITSLDFEAGLDLAGMTAITDEATAETARSEIQAMIETVTSGIATLGARASRISDQADYVGAMADSLKLGVSALVDADMEESSARLQALQTQQQLGIQALSIANQAPSAILSLFRS